MTAELNPGVVYVCPDRDIECGGREDRWCATCPQRRVTQPSLSTAPELAISASDNSLSQKGKDGAEDASSASIKNSSAAAPIAEGELPPLPTYYYDIDGSLRLKGKEFEYGGVGEYVRLQDVRAYGKECARAALAANTTTPPPIERRRDLAHAKLPLDAEVALELAALKLFEVDSEAHAQVRAVLARHLPKA